MFSPAIIKRWFFILFFLVAPSSAFSQNIKKPIPSTDSGIINKQFESNIPTVKPRVLLPKYDSKIDITEPDTNQRPDTSTAEFDETVTFTIKKIIFINSSLINAEILQLATSKFLNTELSMDDLDDIKSLVIAIYRKQGYLADVVLPEQDITDGELTIEIIESKVGKFIIFPEGDLEISDYLSKIISGNILKFNKQGSPVDLDNFEATALMVDDLNGISAKPSVRAGEAPGTTDLVLFLSPKPKFRVVAIADNTGSNNTGLSRFSGVLSMGSILNMGELISISTSKNENSLYVKAGLSMPITLGNLWSGTFLELTTSQSQYEVLSSAVDLGTIEPPSGKSSSYSLDITQPIFRSIQSNLWFSAGYLSREAADRDRNIYDTDVKLTVGNIFNIGVNGNYFDGFLMGGSNQFSIKLYHGNTEYRGKQSTIETSNQDGATGKFKKLLISAGRSQAFAKRWNLVSSLTLQNSNKNLESAEKFTLGGPSAIRAFPGSEGSGSRGALIKNELVKSINDDLQVTTFYEWGWVQKYIIRKGPQGQKLPLYDNEFNTGIMSGYGINVSYQPIKGLNLSATLAKRDKPNPFAIKNNPEKNGLDSDGTLKLNRFWFNLNYTF